ncbi:MAG: hypothetical protein KAJ92_00145 [Gammaproteobacteria bacterium]|nr:hypothetical protein [Gammaproteobacteria bacterium]MCK5262054.1 hypothetical protein [Gammaproteobacteria bacterium]
MNYIIRLIAIAAVVVAPTGALANTWSCTHDDLIRTVEIEYSDSGETACNVNYTKETEGVEMQTLWSAENQVAYCEEKAEGFVAKLGSWGWDCTKSETEAEPEPEAAEVTPEAEPATETPAGETPAQP